MSLKVLGGEYYYKTFGKQSYKEQDIPMSILLRHEDPKTNIWHYDTNK